MRPRWIFEWGNRSRKSRFLPPPRNQRRVNLPYREKTAFAGMALGSLGVVFGDIGTSPLYALRESLNHIKAAGVTDGGVIGTISLLMWALFFTVTAKYVLFLMHADNRGEGGILSLMALAQSALGHAVVPVFFLGVAGRRCFRATRSSRQRFRSSRPSRDSNS